MYIYIYIYIHITLTPIRGGVCKENASGLAQYGQGTLQSISIVLEAPIPERSFGDKTYLYVINPYSDKQQLSHKITLQCDKQTNGKRM